MIYPISNIFSTHTEVLVGENNDFTEFLDRLFDTLTKYELGFFKSSENRIYKAELISRQDIHEEKKITIHDGTSKISYIATRRIQVILEYRFNELK